MDRFYHVKVFDGPLTLCESLCYCKPSLCKKLFFGGPFQLCEIGGPFPYMESLVFGGPLTLCESLCLCEPFSLGENLVFGGLIPSCEVFGRPFPSDLVN